MARRTGEKMDFGRKLLLAGVGVVAVAAPIVVGMTDALPLGAQSPSTPHLAFEVASVKLNTSSDPRAGLTLQFLPGGKFVSGLPLNFVIATAYNLPFQSGRITGGPDWIRTERYNIEATAEKGAIPAGVTVKERNDKMRLMLQTLLAERFKMVIRRETKELPVYAIVVAKDGPKLQKAAVQDKNCPDVPSSLGDSAACHGFGGGQGRGLHAQAVDMSDLALYVSNWADRPVIDKTGIKGLFQIDTKPWAPLRPGPPPPPGAKAEDGSNFADLPSLFDVFAQLGLKLESQKAQRGYVRDRKHRSGHPKTDMDRPVKFPPEPPVAS